MTKTAIPTLICVVTLLQVACNKHEEMTMLDAQDYIAAFRRGEDFRPPAIGVFVDDQPDGAALDFLGRELAVGSAAVRENIVSLVVDMGRRTDPLQPKGADVLRHRQIIELLAGPGLAKPDLGREAAMDALRKLVTQPDLARSGDAFTKTLEVEPTEEAFLLVAKAKPKNAKELVERLAKSREWKDVEAAKIARAALGATDVETEFLDAVDDADSAQDGEALGHAIGTLGLIGTPRSLKTIAEHLRTPLTILLPGAFEKSVRLNVLEALLYNFPDQPVLYPNNIINEANYTAAEQFCIKTLEATYAKPPPPFLTYRGFPSGSE